MHDASESNTLGDYLRARRGLIDPVDAGLPATGTRRVPGLRREEAAMLAQNGEIAAVVTGTTSAPTRWEWPTTWPARWNPTSGPA